MRYDHDLRPKTNPVINVSSGLEIRHICPIQTTFNKSSVGAIGILCGSDSNSSSSSNSSNFHWFDIVFEK